MNRSHDKEIYLTEHRYDKPKEITKRLTRLIGEDGAATAEADVYDIGCAAGEFLYHFVRSFPTTKCHGVDYLEELLVKARRMVPEATFFRGSVLDRSSIEAGAADITLLQGVHSIFDDFEPVFENLIHWTRPGGRVYIFGLFNPHPVNVWVRYRNLALHDPEHREAGWNLFSKQAITEFLDKKLGSGRHQFIPFEMPFDLQPHPDDPVRTWTFCEASGRRIFTNGLSIIVNLEILSIRR